MDTISLLLVGLTVLSAKVSAFTLVCFRMFSEAGLLMISVITTFLIFSTRWSTTKSSLPMCKLVLLDGSLGEGFCLRHGLCSHVLEGCPVDALCGHDVPDSQHALKHDQEFSPNVQTGIVYLFTSSMGITGGEDNDVWVPVLTVCVELSLTLPVLPRSS